MLRKTLIMEKLNFSDYHIAKDLLHRIQYQTVLHTILSDQTPGRVYVDKKIAPKLAFAQFKQRAFLAGDPDPNFIPLLREFVFTEVKRNCEESDVPFFRLTVDDPRWLKIFRTTLEFEHPIQTEYRIYQKKSVLPLKKILIPEGFKMLSVDRTLIQKAFPGKGDLLEEMSSERESVDAFIESSFGIAAFISGSLAGWCLSEYNFQDQCEIGIATLLSYRRIGLAKAMTYTFQNQAIENGIKTLLWHCFASNQASCQTALSTGFKLVDSHEVLMLYWDSALNLAVHGNINFEKSNFAEAAAWYEKALSQENPRDWMAWNAACASTHLNEIDAAFYYLELAINLGFDNLEHLKNSDHLTPIKKDPRWDELITRLKKI